MMLPGLVLPANQKFAEVIRPLAAEIAPCFWVIRHQSGGPFDSLFLSQNEALFDKQRLDLAACHYTDCSCWRPHTFPRLADHVFVDECTCFLALRRGETEIRELVEAFLRITGGISSYLEQQADLLLFYGDGWWEMYTPHALTSFSLLPSVQSVSPFRTTHSAPSGVFAALRPK